MDLNPCQRVSIACATRRASGVQLLEGWHRAGDVAFCDDSPLFELFEHHIGHARAKRA